MDKVIVERPRWGSRLPSRKKGYRKYIASTPIDNLPRREPMLGRWQGRQRHLSEHLGPMKRFLRSRVGRPWEKIHEELCEHVSFANPVQSHVLDHIFDFVHENVEVINRNHVITQKRNWWRGGRLRQGDLYICPKSRILKAVAGPRLRTSHPEKQFPQTATTKYLLKENHWWEVRLCRTPDHPAEQWDVWLEETVTKIQATKSFAPYGAKYFAVSKRLLTPREAKTLRSRCCRKNRKHR